MEALRSRWIATLLGFAALSVASPSLADLTSADYCKPGDGLLTLDSATGKYWLDHTFTQGWSIARARSELTEFTVADTTQVRQLFTNAGLVLDGSCNPFCDIYGQGPVAQTLIGIFGNNATNWYGMQGFLVEQTGLHGFGLGAAGSSQVSFYPLEITEDMASHHSIWLYSDGIPKKPEPTEKWNFEFTGTIAEVDANLLSHIPIRAGDKYTLTYQFGIGVKPILPWMEPIYPTISMSFSTNSSEPVTVPLPKGHVGITDSMYGGDFFNVMSRSGVTGGSPCMPDDGNSALGTPIGTATVDVIQLFLGDPTGTALSSSLLGATPPDISKFTSSAQTIADLFGRCSGYGCSALQIAFLPLSGDPVYRRVVGTVDSVRAFQDPPPDSTPPVVSAEISGIAGNDGWYVGDAIVNWSVTDSESNITNSSGCDAVTLAIDSSGTTYTCTATSAGGMTTESVTIKRDATAPMATATPSPLPNSAGWHKASVSVAFSGTDTTSGIASCSPNVMVATEGANQISTSGTCTDVAGNVSTPVTYSPINIDLTPPAASAIRAPAANAAGWNKSEVTVAYSALDALSGVAADGCSLPNVLNANGAGQSATGMCSDRAGNSASAAVSGINIDLTPPIAAASVSPAANAANWHRTPVMVSFSGTDALSGSGIAGCSANGLINTDGAGQTRAGTCTDVADNVSAAASATVNLDPTVPTITLTAPASGATYTQNAVVASAYNCADVLSGVIGCLGTVPNASAFSTSKVGTNSFTVQATDLAGNSASRTVTYSVVAPLPFALTPSALAFGDRLLNSSTALAVTIRNTSAASLALTAPSLAGTNANQFTLVRTCRTSLAANASCTVTATFRPTTAGAKTASFSIRIGTVTQTVALSGTGVAVAFAVSPTSIAFANQTRNTTGAAQPVTVTNQTSLPITLSTIALGGTNANQFVLTRNCGTTLAANSTCTVSVAFRPTSAGAKRATLTVTPSGATAKTVALTGTGL